MYRIVTLLLLLGLVFVQSGPAAAHEYKLGRLRIHHPWALKTGLAGGDGAAYLTITNRSKTADRLLGVTSPVAAKVELQVMVVEEGVLVARPVSAIEIAAGATLSLMPGGAFLMLKGLKHGWVERHGIPVELRFKNAGTIGIKVMVEKPGTPGQFIGHRK